MEEDSVDIDDPLLLLLHNAGIDVGGVEIHDKSALLEVMKGGTLALGETYMAKRWDCRDLDKLMTEVLRKRSTGKLKLTFRDGFGLIWGAISDWGLNPQMDGGSLVVGKHHYDIGNTMFRHMLGSEMIYSCGYWKGLSNWAPQTDLDKAQLSKMEMICRKLKIEKGMRILDIGCGWGGFARYTAGEYGAKVVGITISKEQYKYCQEQDDETYGGGCEFYLASYYDLPELDESFEGSFDRVVSIGMCEHVGYKNYQTFMNIQCQMLKPGGMVMLHTIVGNESKLRGDSWYEKYIFPNSMLPSLSQLASAAENVLVMEDIHNIGVHYDKTLMAWHKNFNQSIDLINDELDEPMDETFIRMWNYYLLFSAALFRSRTIQLYQIVLSKEVYEGYERPYLVNSHDEFTRS